jgi:hypothetical protein
MGNSLLDQLASKRRQVLAEKERQFVIQPIAGLREFRFARVWDSICVVFAGFQPVNFR